MGFFSGLLQAGAVFALDAFAALLNGPAPQKQKDLANKTYSSDAYGRTWPRARGTVRLNGSVIAMSKIRTTVHKTVSGGLFGIGSTSVYYNTYSASIFVAFGKKLGGGPAVQFLRLIADGKDLFNAHVSDGTISGTVSVTVVGGGQLTGAQNILFDVASGATLKLNAGDLISVPGDPNFPYEVQAPINVTGPLSSIAIPIWPPLRVDLAGGGALSIFGLNASPYDLSSFDPDPHDGSHIDAGYVPGPGGIRFYLGSDTQIVEPDLIKMFGPGNSPAYRGLVGCWIHDLELANYGNHIPQWSAEIAFDTANGQFPNVGPVSGTNIVLASLFPEFIALPFSGNSSTKFINPLITRQQLPYVWIFSQVGSDSTHLGTIYRINTQTNALEQSRLYPGTAAFGLTPAGMVADADGFLYFIVDNATLYKIDGQSMGTAGTLTGVFAGIPDTLYCWDTQQSLFGNPVTIKLLMAGDRLIDRTVLLPLGTPNPMGAGSVVIGYDKNGKPTVVTGDYVVPSPGSAGNSSSTDDAQGNFWTIIVNVLHKVDCQFISLIDVSDPTNPQPVLSLPSFSDSTVTVSPGGGGGATPGLQYYAGDNTIVVIGVHTLIKVDASTMAVLQTVTGSLASQTKISQTYDPMGGLLVETGTTPGLVRVDLATLTDTATYNLANFVPGGTGIPLNGYAIYDPYSDSVWYDASNNGVTYGGFNRAFLDRATGLGFGLDAIVSSIMAEAGFDPSQYDVTQLTASSITVYGVEFDRESYADSLRRLMQVYLFDAAPIDGKIVFIPRGNASVITIPESDLGALDDPSKYEPRVIETLTDPLDTPESVHIHYYDPLKQAQQAVQYAKRISKPYASTLSAGKNVTNSRQQLDITVPITENATQVKQQAEKILWDMWVGRLRIRFKLGPKYSRLTTGDVVTLTYKSVTRDFRIEQIDTGASGALEITAVLQNAGVYSGTYLLGSSAGSGSSTPPTQPPTSTAGLSYTISPAIALSEANATEVDMVQVTATWSDGRTTVYAARAGGSGFVVTDPGAGNTQLYYVTIYDPNRIGELGSPTLTAYCTTTPQGAFLGQTGYVFIGTITITHNGIGVVVTSGGSQNITQAEGFYINGTGGNPGTAKIDLLTYLVNSQRATKHLTGSAANSQAANIYSYFDTATHSAAQIKSASGWAADIQLYDSQYIYQFITELDDPGYRLWSDSSSYKKYQTPLKMMPRYLTPGVAIPDIVNSGSNPYNRYTSCGLIDTINRGVVTCRNYLTTLNLDNAGAGGGNLGTISVLVHERYAGNSRERMYWGLNLGFVKWDAATLVSGSPITGVYNVTNWAVHNQLVSGGAVSPSFSCGYGVGWP